MTHIPYITNQEYYVTDGAQYQVVEQSITTFSLNLYQNTAEQERVDKSSYLTYIDTLNGVLREECSIINPSILIEYTGTLPTFNYIHIPIFQRYYYVRNIISVRKNLWRIDCSVDVLMTYNSGIRNLEAYIGRQEFDYNNELIDSQLPCEKQSTIMVFDWSEGGSNTGYFNNQLEDGAHNFVLTVVGA